jgi:signal peptidase
MQADFCSACMQNCGSSRNFANEQKKVRYVNWNHKPQWNWLILLAAVLSVPLLLNLVLSPFVNAFYIAYIIRPAFWGMLAVIILRLPSVNSIGKTRMRPFLIKFALGVAFFQIYLMVVAGFFNGFGKSPYSFTIKGVLINLIYVGTALIGMELSRAWLVNRVLRKPAVLLPVLVALLYTLIDLPLGQIPPVGGTLEAWTSFLGSTCLPLSLEHLLASILAMWGGPLPAIAYRGVLQAFEWFSPVLPDLNWAMKALVGTAVPVVALGIIQEYFSFQLAPCCRRKKRGEQGIVSAAAFSVAAVIAIWFSLGVFPVKPAVIYSGSMRPSIEVGDIVIVAQKNPSLLDVGDVISYRVKDSPIPIVHRVITIEGDGSSKAFITKGDDNKEADQPVKPEQVMGKVVLKIPRVGWASIAIRKFIISG